MSLHTVTVVAIVRAAERILSERVEMQSPEHDREIVTRLQTLFGEPHFQKAMDHLEGHEGLMRNF
jgi:hypothetical protein